MQYKVLIVEDEVIVALSMQMELEALGYKILGMASNAKDAVLQALEKKPDIILMDIHLAGRSSGIEAALEIRKTELIPIVFLTGYSDLDLLEQIHGLPFTSHMVKPVGAVLISQDIQKIMLEIRNRSGE